MQFTSVISLSLLLAAFSANANLLISPVKVEFSDRDRMHEIVLINSSQETRSYRLDWEEKKAVPQGGFAPLTEVEQKNALIASPMLRFSPRQVTLKPRERQTVKVMLRRQNNLSNGSYKSFLKFVALPPVRQIRSPAEGMNIVIEPLLSYSLPVIVHQGALSYQVSLDNADFVINNTSKKGEISLTYSRKGNSAIRANFVAYWTPKGGQEIAIARINDLSLYPEVSQRSLKLGWIPDNFTNSAGTLRVVAEGVKSLNGKILAEKVIPFSSVKSISQ